LLGLDDVELALGTTTVSIFGRASETKTVFKISPPSKEGEEGEQHIGVVVNISRHHKPDGSGLLL
jgi:hypothetical protein